VRRQQTIAKRASCTGIGLHCGAPVTVTLLPARIDAGIVFERSDLAGSAEIPANASAVRSTRQATTLGIGDATIGTVEHLLATLYGLGIDNVRVVVDGPELPVMDGSAAPFVYLVRAAGIHPQRAKRTVLRFRRPLEVRDGERWIRVEPARRFRASYAVDFEHPAVRRQEFDIDHWDAEDFEREISGARTFGFLNEVRALWDAGLAKGGSLENTVVLDDRRVVNPEGLRWPDEFVRHKVLDLYGDLALLGHPVEGHFRVERGGHSMHLKLVSAILENPDAWRVHEGDRSVPTPVDLMPLARPLLAR